MFNFELFGLATFFSPYSVLAFCYMGVLLIAAILTPLTQGVNQDWIDRNLFWAFGFLLYIFAALRPIGLALDDHTYVDILDALCPVGDCASGSSIYRDYVWYGLVSIGLWYWPGGLDIALVISSLGVFVKLFVIDKLCRQRLLALLLLVPLSFIQYDMTQLRAGFASSWMLLGIYWLVRARVMLGSLMLLSNFMVHLQAIFTPCLLAYKLIGLKRWIFPMFTAIFLVLMYVGLSPDLSMLGSIGLTPQSALYLLGGGYKGDKVFPWGYLPVLAYGLWVWSSAEERYRKIANVVGASLLLGLALAWFFAAVPIIQTRLFDFYALPLVLLAGNIGNLKIRITLTSLLAIALYLRLELLQDWILG